LPHPHALREPSRITRLTCTTPSLHAEPDHHSDPALTDDEQARLWLSACADGEAQAVGPACKLWRDDAGARQTWHRYHLIGDVMRSEELATAPARDAAFLAGLRERLAAEPTVLAPAALGAPGATAAKRPAWRLPAAMAASFVLVAGAFTVARLGPVSAGGEWAAGSSPAAVVAEADTRSVSDGAVLITDPRLDEFLRAHQAMGGSMLAAAPGSSLRRVEGIVPAVARR
jgi:sigma-E factor negative regulatory protein RseA